MQKATTRTLHSPLPRKSSNQSPRQKCHRRHQFHFTTNQLYQHQATTTNSKTRFPRRPHKQRSTKVTPRRMLPLLSPTQSAPNTRKRPRQPLRTSLLLQQPTQRSQLKQLHLSTLIKVLQPTSQSTQRPRPVQRPNLYKNSQDSRAQSTQATPAVRKRQQEINTRTKSRKSPLHPQGHGALAVEVGGRGQA